MCVRGGDCIPVCYHLRRHQNIFKYFCKSFPKQGKYVLKNIFIFSTSLLPSCMWWVSSAYLAHLIQHITSIVFSCCCISQLSQLSSSFSAGFRCYQLWWFIFLFTAHLYFSSSIIVFSYTAAVSENASVCCAGDKCWRSWWRISPPLFCSVSRQQKVWGMIY